MTLDPYHRWLGIALKDQPPNHYRLLGIDLFESDREVIADAAMQRMAHVRTYQLGRNQALSQRILNELAAAKTCLLDAKQKANYDAGLRQRMARTEQGAKVAVLDGAGRSSKPAGRGGAGILRSRLVRLSRWVTDRLSALRRSAPTPGKASPSSTPPRLEQGIGTAAGPAPPPLPSPCVAPPLPAGLASPPGPVRAHPGHAMANAKEAPGQEDPFEKLRSTAIQSLRDRTIEDEPRQLPRDAEENMAFNRAESAQGDGTELCQPDSPYPVPILWILDDGQRTGQAIRMRKFPFWIGRTRGDACIAHDPAIDDPHVELSWCDADSGPQLVIRDLGSRTGLFVRAAKAKVKAGQEIRIGAGCYRFSEPDALDELSPQTEQRLALAGEEVWLGRSPACEPLHLGVDPMVDGRHARITRGEGVWGIEDNDSLNGTWIRVPQIVVRTRAEFFIGEQALVVAIPRRAAVPRTINRGT